MSMDSLLTALGIKKVSVVVAGAIGGLISLRQYTELSYGSRAMVVLSSMALANYLTRPLVVYFGESASEFELGIAAAVGLFGVTIVSSATALIKDTAYWKDVISKFFTGRRDRW